MRILKLVPRPNKEVHAKMDTFVSRVPSPDAAAVAADLSETMLKGLQPYDARVLTLLFRGHTDGEIANRIGCRVSTVRFRLRRIQDRLRQPSS